MQVRQGTKMQQQPEPPTTEIVLDTGGWLSGPMLHVQHRPLARDIRSDRVGEVMAKPEGVTRMFWLRPVGGGIEWDVPKQFVQMLAADDEAAA